MAGRGGWKDLSGSLSLLSSLYSLFALLAYIVANRFLFDPVRAAWSGFEFAKIFIQYILLAVPFAFAGMIIAGAIRGRTERVHRIYLADMTGAATGCLLILLILSHTGGEGAVRAAVLLGLAASLLFGFPASTKGKAVAAAVFLLTLIIGFGIHGTLRVKMSPYKPLPAALNFPGGKLMETLYSPSGQLDIIDSPAVRAAPGIGLGYEKLLPAQRGFTINGGGLSTVTDRRGDLAFLTRLPSALAYRLKPGAEVFVVDPGGGMELLSALENGAKSVTGSERSGVIIEAMRGEFLPFSGNLYSDLGIMKGAARNLLPLSGRRYDLITLPLTDTLGAGSSGIRGLQEDYGLTAEAIANYLGHLKEGGYLASSLYLLPPPRTELKLLSTVVEALKQSGVEAAGERIMAIRSWGVLVLLVKKGVITGDDVRLLNHFCEAEGFDPVWYPGMEESAANQFNRFEEPLYYRAFKNLLDPASRPTFLENYLFNLDAATDERPFFGQTFRLTRMKETFENVGRKWGILIEGGYLLPWIFIQSVLASVLLIFVPYLLFRKGGEASVSLLPTGVYFAAIGIGFMFLEIALIQRLIPLLGEAVYAFSAVLFSLLLATGMGSWLAGSLRLVQRRGASYLLILPLMILLYAPLLGPVSETLAGFSLTSRYVTVFLMLFPLGMVMGFPFPTGMALLAERDERLIPLAWCINGCFSVVSSVAAMMVALVAGFSSLFVLAAVCYLIAFGAMVLFKR